LTSQRYVSNELTHFVGAKLRSEEEQFQLLVKILTEGRLQAPASPSLRIYEGPFCKHEMFNPSCVCFCDIPLADLNIHIEKYSAFGVSFSKRFLIEQGANPVFYVAYNSRVTEPQGEGILWTKAERRIEAPLALNRVAAVRSTRYVYFNKALKEYIALFDKLRGQSSNWVEVRRFEQFLNYHIFSYIKCFDDSLDDDAFENFYMEREWRVLDTVKFGIKDVRRVILPEDFSPRLRSDLPVFTGQITFAQKNKKESDGG